MTYNKAINMFDVEQVGKWCERIYNKDAEYKYISPYVATWSYKDLGGKDEDAETFTDKLFMLQGSRTAHRRWWLSRRFNLLDGRWSSGDFATKYVEIKCDYGAIGDKFTAIAGANAYFGYQINNRTFGDAEGGETQEYKANSPIKWELRKVIQIGDPIAIYGSTDLLELNLQGISKNLSSVAFKFGTNSDLGNKLERFILSIPDDDLRSKSSYKTYADDEVGTSGRKTGFEKIKDAYPFEITSEDDFSADGKYPTVEEMFNANDANSPKFYRIVTTDDDGKKTYVYFAKLDGGIRNYACNTMSFDNLSKLQVLKMAGYMSVVDLNLSKNTFINDVDIRYSGVKTIDFGSGSRIKNFKASDKLTTLSFTECDNIKLSNIFINDTTLKNDGGKNINIINVINSKGLNHSSDFRDFILKWMQSGDVTSKKLILSGVNWSGFRLSDLEIIKKFLSGDENGKHAIECVIGGIINMSSYDRITSDDLNMFKELSKALGGGLTIRVPNANIVVNSVKSEVVAGDTAEFTFTLFPNAKEVLEDKSTVITCTFVKIVDTEDFETIKDNRTNRIYKPIHNSDEVRPGINISLNKNDFTIKVSTTENAVGGDTNALILAKLEYNGQEAIDIVPLVIKEPTYAVSGVINGVKNIGEKETMYTYTLNIVSNTNDYPIGTIDIEWSVVGNGVEIYLSKFDISEDKKTYTITTSQTLPDPTGELTIVAKIINHDASSTIVPSIPKEVIIEKPLLLLNEKVVLTIETNPVVFNICREQGWATISDIVMMRDEAEAVTNIGSVFANVKKEGGWSFEEFKYFTNVKLTSLNEGAFANSDITSIIFPENIYSLGNGLFENCKYLKNVQIGQNITEIPERCFLNCGSLENFVLPDNVTIVKIYAFGGTGIEQILEKGDIFDINPKTIYLTQNSLLERITNNAFETTIWSPFASTNMLKVITLPKLFGFSESNYNFTLGENLTNIIILNEDESGIVFRDNLLFASYSESVLVRAMPYLGGNEPIDTVELIDVNTVYPYAFYKCNTINNVVLGRSVYPYGLGIGAFYDSAIKTVDMSQCVEMEEVQEFTFNECRKLEEIIFPMDARLTTFGKCLFSWCDSLSALTLPNTLTTIKTEDGGFSKLFVSCNALEEITFPDSLLNSDRYLFEKCNSLKKIVLPTYFQNIGSYDYIMECPAFEELVLPVFSYTNEENENVIINTSVGMQNPYAFIDRRCTNFSKFTLNEKDNHRVMIEEDGILYRVGNKSYDDFFETPKTLCAVPYKIDETFILKDDVFAIENYAISNNTCLTKFIAHSGVTKIEQNTFQNCENLEELYLMGDITKIDRFALCHCVNLSKIVLLSLNAPELDHGSLFTDGKIQNTDIEFSYYKYHPFGYDEFNWVGYNTKEKNILYLPYGYNGYEKDDWVLPLFTVDQCSFEKAMYTLDDEPILTVYNQNGEEITDKPLYLKSDSGEFVYTFNNSIMSITYDDTENGYVVNFDNKVYHNEPISVYEDIDCTKLLGSFIAKYGEQKYTIGSPVLSYKTRSIFSTTIFGSGKTVESDPGDEIVNIKRRDYEILISRVNQLTEQMNKLKKK